MKTLLAVVIAAALFLVGCQDSNDTKTNRFVEGTVLNLPMGLQATEKDLRHISHALEKVPDGNSEIWFLSPHDPRVIRVATDLGMDGEPPAIAIEVHMQSPRGGACRNFVLHSPFLTEISESLKFTKRACRTTGDKWEMK